MQIPRFFSRRRRSRSRSRRDGSRSGERSFNWDAAHKENLNKHCDKQNRVLPQFATIYNVGYYETKPSIPSGASASTATLTWTSTPWRISFIDFHLKEKESTKIKADSAYALSIWVLWFTLQPTMPCNYQRVYMSTGKQMHAQISKILCCKLKKIKNCNGNAKLHIQSVHHIKGISMVKYYVDKRARSWF